MNHEMRNSQYCSIHQQVLLYLVLRGFVWCSFYLQVEEGLSFICLFKTFIRPFLYGHLLKEDLDLFRSLRSAFILHHFDTLNENSLDFLFWDSRQVVWMRREGHRQMLQRWPWGSLYFALKLSSCFHRWFWSFLQFLRFPSL